jgi:hypothetical protein
MDATQKGILIFVILLAGGIFMWLLFRSTKPSVPTDSTDPTGPTGLDDNTFLGCDLIKNNNITSKDLDILKINPNLSPASYNSCDDITPTVVATMRNYIDSYGKETYLWQVQPDPTKNTYTYTELSGKGDLYCGLFGKQKTLSTSKAKPIQITLGCECEPVDIKNGTFDSGTCDYTCDEGYEKWFDANGQKYTAVAGLVNNLTIQQLNAKKPPDEPYCIPKTGTTRPCPSSFDTTRYKQAFQIYSNEAWSDTCYARSVGDCTDGYNFQADGTCVSQPALCKPGFPYKPGDPCYTDTSTSTYDYDMCTLTDCDLTKCDKKPSGMGRYGTMEECLKAKKGASDTLQQGQKRSDIDQKVSLMSDGKMCTVGPYSVSCDNVDPSEFYMTSKDTNGLFGLYAMEGTTKKICSGREGFLCSTGTDITSPQNLFQVVNDQLVFRGDDGRPPNGPKICGYNPKLDGSYCPSIYGGKPIILKNLGD